jgi:thiosulfate dehydrogenase (quinone) large subunit
VLGRVLLPLRAFLGFTFCFAGLQKLANPRFFDAADPASIQAQLAAAARRSPVHALISPLTRVAVALGILIAFGELAVGVGTLLGLRARLAAAGGLVLSVMLFLTVSFHSAPYYTGADIVFAFAWTPLLLAGSGSMLSLDAAVKDRAGRQAAAARRLARRSGATVPEVRRREVVLGGMTTAAVAAVSLVIGGLAAGLGRLAGGTAGTGGASSLPSAIGPVPTATAGPSSSSGPKPGNVPSGTAIGPAGRRARRPGRLVPGSGHGRSVDRDPAALRPVPGLRRRMPARRLHSRVRPHREGDRLPMPRITVQRQYRRGRGRPGGDRIEEACYRRGLRRPAIRHLNPPPASRPGTFLAGRAFPRQRSQG